MENLLCYLADRALDKDDVDHACGVLNQYFPPLDETDDGMARYDGPRRPLEKGVLNAITVGHLASFKLRAANVSFELPLKLFEDIAVALFHLPPHPRHHNREYIFFGLERLLRSVELANLLPVLRCLTVPVGLSFVWQWVEDDLKRAIWRRGTYCHKDDAALVFDICVAFPDANMEYM